MAATSATDKNASTAIASKGAAPLNLEDGALPPASGPGLLSPSDWKVLPAWFHLATFIYFSTNARLIYLMDKIAPNWWAKFLGIWGLCVGFIEHISPYYPNIYISVNMERLLGRIPTIIAFIAISRSLGISRKGWIQQIAAQIMFMLQPTLSSMSLPFHLSHIVVQHFGGMHFLNGAYARKLKWEAKIKSA